MAFSLFRNDGARSIAESLKVDYTLEEISLSHNEISGDEIALEIAEAFELNFSISV